MRIRQSKYETLIYSIIAGAGNHMTAEEVYDRAKAQGAPIGIATVYRQLNLLAEKGKIQRIRDKDQGYIYDGNEKPHHHFYCCICGKYTDLSLDYDTAWNDKIAEETGAVIHSHRIVFEGICKHCKAKCEKEENYNGTEGLKN